MGTRRIALYITAILFITTLGGALASGSFQVDETVQGGILLALGSIATAFGTIIGFLYGGAEQ